ncbi:MAG: hypothetical protein RIS90_1971 [Pseudomonadota bacterium]|jgi:hydroxyethylthiazole kinase-like uncharacterized protein yjeF
MRHIRPVTHDTALPLYDAATTRHIEMAALAGQPSGALIRRAGLSVAKLAMAIAPHGSRVWVACGPGNNGADGLEAARHLQTWGKQVFVTTLAHGRADDKATGHRLKQAVDAGVTWMPTPPDHFDACIDAMLGLGCQARPLDGRLAAWIDRIRTQRQPVLSVDLPTGLHPDTGCAAKDAVVADHTLCLLTLKPGLFTANGRDFCGRLWLDELCTAASLLDAPNAQRPTAWLSGAPRPGVRLHASHKGSYGDVGVVGGSRGMTGAALLAASAALHAGAGRVFVSLLDSQAPSVHMNQPELMLRPIELLAIEDMAVVCGCGGGAQIADWLPKLFAGSRALVLDADGLNAVAADPQLAVLLQQRGDRGAATVITPHPLEAARLLGTRTADIQHDRLSSAAALARRFHCTVVLKGSGTVISSPGEVPLINPTGNSRLASAGTGDVLAGMVGAGLAQGLGPAQAAADAVFRHGQRADHWPEHLSLTASRLGSAAWAKPSPPGFSAAL